MASGRAAAAAHVMLGRRRAVSPRSLLVAGASLRVGSGSGKMAEGVCVLFPAVSRSVCYVCGWSGAVPSVRRWGARFKRTVQRLGV